MLKNHWFYEVVRELSAKNVEKPFVFHWFSFKRCPRTTVDNRHDFGGAVGTLGFDPGIEMQAGLGYDFGRFRIEGLFNRSGSDFENTEKSSTYVDIISSTWVANVFMDFNNDSKFVTSLGVGIGGTKHEVASDEDTVLNTDFMVGVGYQITDNAILDIKYTYRMYDDITFGDVRISDESSQSILAGVKIYL